MFFWLCRIFDICLYFIIYKVTAGIVIVIIWAYKAERPKRPMVVPFSFLVHLLPLTKGHLSETSVKSAYTRVMMLIVSAHLFTKGYTSQRSSEHVL